MQPLRISYYASLLVLFSLSLRAADPVASTTPQKAKSAGAPGKLLLPGENFTVEGRPAFVFLPAKITKPQPWIFYAPTLPPYPDEAERWMHEQFLAAGIAVAGGGVGGGFGRPPSHPALDGGFREIIPGRGFAHQPFLLWRSRGGRWGGSWGTPH